MTSAAVRGQTDDHAVVLGAGIAGLLAARVLADTYSTVTVIDRDVLPEIGAQRRGVPQGHHAHVLHPRGREVLEELFPGFTAELVHAGAQLGDAMGEVRIILSGHQLRQAGAGLTMLFASRPFLEGHLRARVRRLPGVTFVENTDIAGLVTTAGQHRVTGVRCRQADTSRQADTIAADLVVDATGRGSRTPRWLSEWGYQRPAQDRIDIGLGYATRIYRLRPGALEPDKALLLGGTPDNPRHGVVSALEGGRHIVGLGGILGDHPPTDPAGFNAFAANMVRPDIAEVLAGAQPLNDPVAFRFPASVRHRYERLSRFPAGLLVLGDAICSFNPVYGQGMAVAANQALVLRGLLLHGAEPAPEEYFRVIATTIDTPWDIAVGADLSFPGVPGNRTAKVRLVNAYLPRLHAAAAHDVTLATTFLRVLGLLEAPEALLRPDRVLRVWWVNRHHPAGPAATGTSPAPARSR